MNDTCLGLDAAPGWFSILAGVISSYHFCVLGFLLQQLGGQRHVRTCIVIAIGQSV